MSHLLTWYNLVFYISLAVGLVFLAGCTLGVHDGHHPDHDHDSDSHEDLLSALGVGKVPLTVIAVMMALLFGGIGTIANFLLSPWMSADVYPWISLPAATLGAIFLTSRCAALLHGWMPNLESYAVAKHELIGRAGTLVLDTDAKWGLAQVHDASGDLHQITCRTREGKLRKGRQVVIFDYDAETDSFAVAAHPPHDPYLS